MKLVLFWSFYEKYTRAFYAKNSQLSQLPYREQLNYLLADYFGWPPALMQRLVDLGHEVEILLVNVEPLQRAWAKENGVSFESDWQFSVPLAQLQQYCPDVLWIGSMFQYYRGYLEEIRPYCKKIFAWIACPLPKALNLDSVDCILTSHTNFQQHFLAQGKPSELLLPAFESNIAESIGKRPQDIECSFAGSLSYGHLQRLQVLKRLVKTTPLTIWGDRPKLRSRGITNPQFVWTYLNLHQVHQRTKPSVWGMDMYRTLARSQICVNIHIDVAGGLAGNMRMFEVTGTGSLLITEDAPNLRDLYEPDREVVTYKNTDELIEKINYYLAHPEQRMAIAQAGQAKTLEHYNSLKRAQDLLTIVHRYL
jgi:spore maturation protein CgeB